MARENKYEVIGIKRIDYTRKDGTEVHSAEYYLSAVSPDANVNGIQCEVHYLKDDYMVSVPVVGDIVCKEYREWNNKPYVCALRVIR